MDLLSYIEASVVCTFIWVYGIQRTQRPEYSRWNGVFTALVLCGLGPLFWWAFLLGYIMPRVTKKL